MNMRTPSAAEKSRASYQMRRSRFRSTSAAFCRIHISLPTCRLLCACSDDGDGVPTSPVTVVFICESSANPAIRNTAFNELLFREAIAAVYDDVDASALEILRSKRAEECVVRRDDRGICSLQ